MSTIMIESKQIAYVDFNEETSTMIVHYHSGEVHCYPLIPKDAFLSITGNPNNYDCLVKITYGRSHSRYVENY